MTKIFSKKAFTLAEVLITLGVIGVVAALTIPVIINFAFEREAVSKAKETYSILTSAWTKWQIDKGCLGDNADCINSGYNAWLPLQIGQELVSYLKVQEVYHNPQAAALANIAWIPTKVVKMDNGAMGGPSRVLTKAYCADMVGSVFLLANGTSFTITSGYGPDAAFPKIIEFTIDINAQKPPNRVGKDEFIISTDRHGLVPFYYCYWGAWTPYPKIDGLCNNTSGTCTNDGHSPMAYILTYDRLPNLKALGYPTNP